MTTTSPVRTSSREVETETGPARVHLHRPAHARGSVVLGHGAGGGVEAPDLLALTHLADDGWLVARVEQPWRVAGKRVAPAPPRLDVAWLAVLAALTSGRWAVPGPLVVGGRSAGARVACRTAAQVGADAVLALSFPLHPPGKPDTSRAHEAQLVVDARTPLGVIQGRKDPFGTPDEVSDALPGVPVFPAQGAHGFSGDAGDVLDEARAWLDRF
ncbi:MAG TPA: alpha/beta family hydrolase [Segeticoccus sp.]|jgi:predicted alpha/beta-hydrolase family hydrolase|nr:alpha/beta family hydrolase [Segeticoccus sp.]